LRDFLDRSDWRNTLLNHSQEYFILYLMEDANVFKFVEEYESLLNDIYSYAWEAR
jgi:hypothetical protein